MWLDVAVRQAGVITRRQALGSGLTDDLIAGAVAAGRWRRLHRGVYLTRPGGVSRMARLWAAVLRAGPDAVLSHETAAELVGLREPDDGPIHVTVPHGRTLEPIAGVIVHRTGSRAHPTRRPPQTRVEETLADLAQTCDRIDDVVALFARAVGARLTTTDQLAAALSRRRRLRGRGPLSAALTDIALGCHSILELLYLRTVERAHGLPAGARQVPGLVEDLGNGVVAGRRRYDDVGYRRYRTVVELDGRRAHPDSFRDMTRDNSTVAQGDRVLRYGMHDVGRYPCRVAAQVVAVLRLGGWRGRPRPCGRHDCVLS